ncbi:MAG: rhomboid family intramembrane serine protease [Chitinispirillales bacterium]|jgi:membrane associated rhomboid family serine protease|nr:rhomboid family intramembrane serine protease [Chitinispirillales bacterium]
MRGYSGSGYFNISPAVKGLIIANVVLFIFQMLPRVGPFVTAWGALSPIDTFLHMQFWRLFSYMFLHSTQQLFHILFNMLALWWFGAELEEIWGRRKFLTFYFICGVGAGLFSILNLITNPYVLVIGASGAVLGVLTAYAHYYPNRQVLLFFIIPVKVRTLVIGYAVLSVFMVSFQAGGTISHLTHLGGIAVAWVYLRYASRVEAVINRHIYSWETKKQRAKAARALNRKRYFEQEIDPILDKIAKNGMDSLTKAEKKILKKASKDKDQFSKRKILPFQ